jgi:hypothetical protein
MIALDSDVLSFSENLNWKLKKSVCQLIFESLKT